MDPAPGQRLLLLEGVDHGPDRGLHGHAAPGLALVGRLISHNGAVLVPDLAVKLRPLPDAVRELTIPIQVPSKYLMNDSIAML